MTSCVLSYTLSPICKRFYSIKKGFAHNRKKIFSFRVHCISDILLFFFVVVGFFCILEKICFAFSDDSHQMSF